MDFHHLRCFAMIAEELHVTRAAERLQIAQPSLTRIIRNLEEELGFALLDSSNKRQIALTPAGRAFFEEMAPLLSQYEHAVQAARRISRGDRGKLVVGYVAAAMFTVLPGIIEAYQRFPEVELLTSDLATRSLSAQLKALQEHRLDVAFCYAPFDDRGIEHECIDRTSLVIALPAQHPLARLEAVPLADLSQERWIWMARSYQPQAFDQWFSLCRQAGFEPRIIETSAGQPHTMISLVEARVGVAFITEWTQRHLSVPGVVYRPLLGPNATFELHMLWRKQERSPLVQTFLQVVREVREKLDAERKGVRE
jgi:DNA-binding transcriptional LysR family regulator